MDVMTSTTYRFSEASPWRCTGDFASTRQSVEDDSLDASTIRSLGDRFWLCGQAGKLRWAESSDTTDERLDVLAFLELAAEANDGAQFEQIALILDWASQPPRSIVRAVKLALMVGCSRLARQLAERGYQLYRDDPELHRLAAVLAPPLISRIHPAAHSSWPLNRQWLKSHAHEFRGQWVALDHGRLIAAGTSLADLRAQVGTDLDVFMTLLA